MGGTTNPEGVRITNSRTTNAGMNKVVIQGPRSIEVIFFVSGVIIQVVASVLVHFHPRPYTFDLQTTVTIQSFQLLPWN